MRKKIIRIGILFFIVLLNKSYGNKNDIIYNDSSRVTVGSLGYCYEWDIIYQDSIGRNYHRHEIVQLSRSIEPSTHAMERIKKMIEYEKIKWIIVLNINKFIDEDDPIKIKKDNMIKEHDLNIINKGSEIKFKKNKLNIFIIALGGLIILICIVGVWIFKRASVGVK